MRIAGKEISNKTKKGLIIGYIVLVAVSALYVRSVINSDEIKVQDEKKEKKSVESKPTKVYLTVTTGTTTKEYNTTLQNVDSVLDFLENLRRHDEFTYEKISYTYGTELENINNQKAPDGYDWRLFLNNEDITYKAADTNLVDETHYELKLVKE